MAEIKCGTRPIVIEETPGQKAYCQCGWSANLPYCDGSHARQQTGVGPRVVSVDAPARKSVCQCHQSANLPWCDGSHKRLAPAG
jgi:CDGSH-type Zn-finger protein